MIVSWCVCVVCGGAYQLHLNPVYFLLAVLDDPVDEGGVDECAWDLLAHVLDQVPAQVQVELPNVHRFADVDMSRAGVGEDEVGAFDLCVVQDYDAGG